jgi:hypothetical protein
MAVLRRKRRVPATGARDDHLIVRGLTEILVGGNRCGPRFNGAFETIINLTARGMLPGQQKRKKRGVGVDKHGCQSLVRRARVTAKPEKYTMIGRAINDYLSSSKEAVGHVLGCREGKIHSIAVDVG